MFEAEVLCAKKAAAQHGVFTFEQAEAAGIHPESIYRRVQSGLWVPLHPRVFVEAATPVGWRTQLIAACFWAGPDAAASHRAAGKVHGLERFEVPFVEITSRSRVTPQRKVRTHCSSTFSERKVTTIDGIRVTTIERTLLDVCAVVRRRTAEAALDGALRRKQTDLDRMVELFISEARKGRRGVRMMREFLSDRGRGKHLTDSDLHEEFTDLLRKGGIDKFEEYFPVRDETGFFVEIDVAFPERMLGFEVEGYSAHGDRQPFDHDRERERKLILRGWTIVRITKTDLRKPAELLHDVRELLRVR
ncbi:MAG: type IV toxin-antitoxin system AbiEi family antitoxin domain-containing protein [Actinobacteria bacterium]|nr:type IV toxin-antitoxin system AbiEi family antitoxin domain-containing protein [Actinomycetota bacterium]